jgi:outer membrane protein OmpA-like peptidoglycan-associated protein/tetratricopeptide (TPR) repeat protein
MRKIYLRILTLGFIVTFLSTDHLYAQLFIDQKADMELEQGNYAKALKLFEELAAQDKSKTKYLAKIGDAQFYLKDYAKAEESYSKYLEKMNSPLSVRLRYAQALMYQGKYESAQTQLTEFKNGNPSENGALADLLLKSIKFATDAQADTNSKYNVFKSDIKINGLYLGGNSYRDALLTSKPKDAKSATPGYTFASFPFGQDKAFSAITYTDSINSKYYMGSPSFSQDYKTMYFTMNVSDKETVPAKQFAKNNISPNGRNTLSIFSAQLKDGKWSEIQPLSFCSNDFSDTHPSITQDGKYLFFASNRSGGFGGYDIYYSKNEGKGKWSIPINVGGKINTAYDEMNPFALSDTLLYFSSDGRLGYGGADIYYTHGNNGKWGEPINMGPGFNSFADDFGISFDASETYGLFASNRDTKSGNDEIWYFQNVVEYISGNGNTKDKYTSSALPGVTVTIMEKGQEKPLTVLTSDSRGLYAYDKFEPGKKYTIRGEKDGYIKKELNIDPSIADMNKLDLSLDPKLKKNDVFTYNDILFDYDKANLQPASIAILNRLADLLVANHGAIVELSAHTDCRGSDSYNEKLSQRRAESAVNYLVSLGVDENRIIAKGYGEKRLKNRCDDRVICTEEEHLVNRRVEIKVLDVKELSKL